MCGLRSRLELKDPPASADGVPKHHLLIGGFDDLELEIDFFPTGHEVQIVLPDLPKESEAWIPVVQVDQEFEPRPPPNLQQCYSRGHLAIADVGIEGIVDPIVRQIAERIAVNVIAMGQVRSPIRIGPV